MALWGHLETTRFSKGRGIKIPETEPRSPLQKTLTKNPEKTRGFWMPSNGKLVRN